MSSTVSATTKWVDDSSTIAPSSEFDESVEKQAALVGDVASRECDHHSVTIVISELPKARLREGIKHRGLSKMWRAPPIVYITPAEGLQETIDSVKLSSKRPTLNLLASAGVPEICFHVPSHFEKLKVLRCAPKNDGGSLLIDGSSTYHSIRVSRWEANRHKEHTLIVGHQRGVRIKLATVAPDTSWTRITRPHEEYSPTEQDELLQLFQKLSGDIGFSEIKTVIATIMGLVVGPKEFNMGMKAAADGIHVKYAFGVRAAQLGMAGAKIHSIATAAGPAIILGVSAAALVYFIPWEVVFEYLKIGLSWIWDKICKLWEKFKSWVRQVFVGPPGTAQSPMPKPMAFSR
ncbi:hypothetical protein M426DRAFT_325553 [Hypoxylon sp. CI-4A]|nr:hypothetical protein M426DRAFT_325553 [Hypoxylon sp. CI-4A]